MTGLTVVACVSSSTPAPSTDPGGVNVPAPSGPVGGGHVIDGGPNELPDAGVPIDPCIGVSCDAPQVCSAGQCVDHDTDADGDGADAAADCDDHDPAIHPGATEVCNNKDDNCDKQIDEGFDKDGDGFYQCVHGDRVVDCNDANPAINDPNKAAHPATADIFQPTPNAHWAKVGPAATINPSGSAGWTQLTSNAASIAGALWWNAPYTFDHFDLTTRFFMQAVDGGGDGLTFAWVPGADVSKAGSQFGFTGLGGYAVALDDIILPVAIVILDSKGSYLKVAELPDTVDVRGGTTGHEMHVVFNAGKVTVSIDGTAYITGFAIPGYAPFSGHWGFTAGNGTTGQTQFVGNVTMSFPDGQGCVP